MSEFFRLPPGSSGYCRYSCHTTSGRFRTTVEATPAGASARIGLSVSVSEAANTNTAALFLQAETDGTSSVLIRADRFAVVNGAASEAPFIVDSGVVYLKSAMIKAASITSLEIAGNAITVPVRTFDPAIVDNRAAMRYLHGWDCAEHRNQLIFNNYELHSYFRP